MAHGHNDPITNTVNQLSIIMQVSEDIVKAARKADMHPAMLEVLMKMHETQRGLQKEINEHRAVLVEATKSINMLSEFVAAHDITVNGLAKASNINLEELVNNALDED